MATAATAALSLLLAPSILHAQSVTDPEDEEAGNSAADEGSDIIVTARRRAESLQDVPIAVSSFSNEQLFEQQIETLTDLPGAVPNLNVSYITAGSTAIIFLRGAGQDDTNPPSEQPITVYLDGVPYLKAPGAVFDLINLESLEVLRGPQGTLYGRNATGGAIKLRTRRPSLDAARGLARATFGSFNRLDFAGSFSAPLSEQFAVGVDVVSRSDDGFIKDALADQDPRRPKRYNATDRQILRLSALWQPASNLRVFVAGDYTDENPGPFAATPALTSAPAANFVNGKFVDTPDLFGSPYRAAPTLFGETSYTGYGSTLNAEYDFEGFSLEAVAGYRGFKQANAFDTDGAASTVVFQGQQLTRSGNAFDFVRDWEHDAYTLELKAATTGTGPLTFVGGIFLLREENVATSVLGRFTDPANQTSRSATAQDQDQVTKSFAVFGEVSYRPIERIELTAGLRYTADEKQLTVRQYGAFGLPLFAGAFFPAFGPVSAEAEFDRLTPRFIANFKLTDDVSLYASYSQGFQAGAFQGFQLSAANAVVPINETIVHSYEAGLRSQFFDRRLTVNITGFHADYKDLPTTQFTSASGFLEASTFDASIRGVEFDISARPLPGLSLSAVFGITDTKTPTDIPAVIAPPQIPGRTQNELKYVSPFSGQLNAVYTSNLPGSMGSLRFSGNLTRQGRFFSSTRNNPFSYEDGYTLLGAQVDYTTADEGWSLGAGVRNLTDEVYELRSSADGGGSRTYGPPRTWYVTAQFRY
jgi:iron complex outermembrane receptor protein